MKPRIRDVERVDGRAIRVTAEIGGITITLRPIGKGGCADIAGCSPAASENDLTKKERTALLNQANGIFFGDRK